MISHLGAHCLLEHPWHDTCSSTPGRPLCFSSSRGIGHLRISWAQATTRIVRHSQFRRLGSAHCSVQPMLSHTSVFQCVLRILAQRKLELDLSLHTVIHRCAVEECPRPFACCRRRSSSSFADERDAAFIVRSRE